MMIFALGTTSLMAVHASMPAAPRHPHVHQHDVGQQVGGLVHGLGPVTRLADDLDVVLLLENDLQAAAEQGMVVDYEDANRLSRLARPVRSARRDGSLAHPLSPSVGGVPA